MDKQEIDIRVSEIIEYKNINKTESIYYLRDVIDYIIEDDINVNESLEYLIEVLLDKYLSEEYYYWTMLYVGCFRNHIKKSYNKLLNRCNFIIKNNIKNKETNNSEIIVYDYENYVIIHLN